MDSKGNLPERTVPVKFAIGNELLMALKLWPGRNGFSTEVLSATWPKYRRSFTPTPELEMKSFQFRI